MRSPRSIEASPFLGMTSPVDIGGCGLRSGTYCGHLLGGEDLVIRWYARALDAATLLKAVVAVAALVALVVGAGADWRWD
jgi:hypothetical protein